MKIQFGIKCTPGIVTPDVCASRVFNWLGINPIAAVVKPDGTWVWQVTTGDDFDFDKFGEWMELEMSMLYSNGQIQSAHWYKLQEQQENCAMEVFGDSLKSKLESILGVSVEDWQIQCLKRDWKAFCNNCEKYRDTIVPSLITEYLSTLRQ